MLTLAIGDIYVPTRATCIPSEFCKLLSPNHGSIPGNQKIDQVLCLGNVAESAGTLAFIHGISRSFHIARGESDDVSILKQELKQLDGKDYPLATFGVITTDGLRIGFTNGYLIVPRSDPMALLILARELDVDILVWGGTHKVEAYTLDGKFFVNPGSASGAYTFDWPINYDDDEGEENDAIGGDDSEHAVTEDAKADSAENDNGEDTNEAVEKHATDGNHGLNKEKAEAAEVNDLTNSQNSNRAEYQSTDTNGSDFTSTGSNEDHEKDIAYAEKKLLSVSLADGKKLTKPDLFGQENDESQEKGSGLDDDNDDEMDDEIIEKAAELTSATPSFCLLDTAASTCTLFIYTYVDGQVKVDKVVYKKEH